MHCKYKIGAYLQDSESSVETYHFLTPGVCIFFSHLYKLGMGGWVSLTLHIVQRMCCKNDMLIIRTMVQFPVLERIFYLSGHFTCLELSF